MYQSSLSLFRVCVKSMLGFQFPCFYCVFFVFCSGFLGLGFRVCMHAHVTCMPMQTRNVRVCICIQLVCARMSYVCACILKSRKSNSISIFFSFILFTCFSLYFKLVSVSLSLLLSSLFQFACFIPLMLIRVLDCLNTMNMHINMNIH